MSLISIILTIAIIGLVVWIILQIPMPAPFKNVIIGVALLLILLWLLKHLGVDLMI
jgi:hypothetical protein